MKSNEMQVQVRIPCATCGGTGWGELIPQREPQLGGPLYFACAGCNGSGATSTEWVSIRALAALIADEQRNATNARHF